MGLGQLCVAHCHRPYPPVAGGGGNYVAAQPYKPQQDTHRLISLLMAAIKRRSGEPPQRRFCFLKLQVAQVFKHGLHYFSRISNAENMCQFLKFVSFFQKKSLMYFAFFVK
jgi:hypothetical protein